MIKLKNLLAEDSVTDKKKLKQIEPLMKSAWRDIMKIEKLVKRRKQTMKLNIETAQGKLYKGDDKEALSMLSIRYYVSNMKHDIGDIIRSLEETAERIEQVRK